MEDRIPTSVLSIIEASQEKGEKLTTLICRMTGSFKPFQRAVIFPGEKEFQVKDVVLIKGDTYKVKVKGIPYKSLTPFSIITPLDLKVKYSKKAYFIPSNFHDKEFYPGDYVVTGGIFTGYRLFNKEKYKAKVRRVGNLYSAELPFKSPLVPGAEYHFENSSGFTGDMKLIYPGYLDKKSENVISSRIDKFRSRPGVKGIYSIILRTDSIVDLPYFLKEEEFDGSIKMGSIRVMEREYNSVKNRVIKQSKASGGVEFSKLKKSIKVSPEFFHSIINSLIGDETLFKEGDYLVFNGEDRVSCLSPLAKEGYKLIVEAGTDGLSSRDIKNYGMINCFQEIKRMRLAYVLDEDLYYSAESFPKVLKKVFSDKVLGDKLTIQDVRDRTDLSRRYIISLLNYLEEREYIIREFNDDRIIKKMP